MKQLATLTALVVLSALTGMTALASEAPTNAVSPPAKKAEPKKAEAKKGGKSRKLPSQGEVKAVNGVAKTFTIGERVFQVTSETRFEKEGKPATFADLKTGEHVTLSYTKSAGDKLQATSVFLGQKPGKGAKEVKESGKKNAPKNDELKKEEPKPAK
jgi:hypothetical protein